MSRILGAACAIVVVCLPATAGGRIPHSTAGGLSEVVVTLTAPPLAGATGHAATDTVTREQSAFATALHRAIPSAQIRWRYRLVMNGAAVVVPQREIPRLRALPGVISVDTGASYRVAATTEAAVARATKRWQTGLPNRGDGVKIGIIDDGVDQSHRYFSPVGYTMPPGFPKGQTAYTTAKVIVARAFAPAGTKWKNALKPFDAVQSEHATHVAGIAAGNANTAAGGGATISGVAPRAYIGNYKALSVPTDAGVGLDGNAPEIVAAIEAAVADGMDIINLSIGEPEIAPSRDLVALALDAAARGGVIPVVAAGNDFDEFGRGSLSSPGSSDLAITVAAVTSPDGSGPSTLASFSGSGPTPISLRLKPDISAPGVGIVSSLPGNRFQAMSGTSMASPQIAGAAALLQERHPEWTVAEIKSALIGSGTPVKEGGKIAPPTRGGGGLAQPSQADVPLILASPASLSLGLVKPGSTTAVSVLLADVGGGPAPWDVTFEPTATTPGATLSAPLTATAPGSLDINLDVAADAAEGEVAGYLRLTRGADVRRIPYWLRVTRPALGGARTTALLAPGAYIGDTRGKPAVASRYRYPEVPPGGPVSAELLGPEQVFRVTLSKPVANFGVVITQRGRGSRVEPRVVSAGDENRLTGYPALPVNLNPYLAEFLEPVLVAGAIQPTAGTYDVVFDSSTAAGAGSYTFRFWLNDIQPPRVRLDNGRVRRGTPLVARLTDESSGVDATTIKLLVDGKEKTGSYRAGVLRIPTDDLRRGKHILRLQVSDYQETRNMENVPLILPNTRVLTTIIVVR